MSKVGTPEENAFIEAFFKTVKREDVYFKRYRTREDVIKNLPKFIDEVYNKNGILWTLVGTVRSWNYPQFMYYVVHENTYTLFTVFFGILRFQNTSNK